MSVLPYNDLIWANEFCRIARAKGHNLDIDWIRGWFKDALQCGYDEATSQPPSAASPVEKAKTVKK